MEMRLARGRRIVPSFKALHFGEHVCLEVICILPNNEIHKNLVISLRYILFILTYRTFIRAFFVT
jgi:hypothetical protein